MDQEVFYQTTALLGFFWGFISSGIFDCNDSGEPLLLCEPLMRLLNGVLTGWICCIGSLIISDLLLDLKILVPILCTLASVYHIGKIGKKRR